MRHIMTAAALACVLALAAGCGDDAGTADTATSADPTSSTPSASSSASASDEASPTEKTTPEPPGTVIEMTLKDGAVTPSGDRVEVAAGEPITFVITADAPGELHVHSAEGPEIEFEPGTSEHEVTIDQPGVVEVELHDPELIVVQLQVS
jgi:glucose/arabinose dehydrogenase